MAITNPEWAGRLLSMPSGPEINGLVAEHVLGFDVESQGFSTDLLAAFYVIERLQSRKVCVSIDRQPDGYWCVSFQVLDAESLGGWRDVGSAASESLPLAICRAALCVALEE